MKQLAGTLAIAALALGACQRGDHVAAVEKGVLAQLGVPSSAKWGAIWTPDGSLVCGFVVAKTVDGAYGDKHLFWGSNDRDVKLDNSGMTPVDHEHRRECGAPAKKLYTTADGGPADVMAEKVASEPTLEQDRLVATALRMQDEVRARLKDPRSARWGEVWLASDGRTICGSVSSKNSFGAYTGPSLFVGGFGEAARFELSDDEVATCTRRGASRIIH